MVGSSQTIAQANFTLNTIVAETLGQFADRLEAAETCEGAGGLDQGKQSATTGGSSSMATTTPRNGSRKPPGAACPTSHHGRGHPGHPPGEETWPVGKHAVLSRGEMASRARSSTKLYQDAAHRGPDHDRNVRRQSCRLSSPTKDTSPARSPRSARPAATFRSSRRCAARSAAAWSPSARTWPGLKRRSSRLKRQTARAEDKAAAYRDLVFSAMAPLRQDGDRLEELVDAAYWHGPDLQRHAVQTSERLTAPAGRRQQQARNRAFKPEKTSRKRRRSHEADAVRLYSRQVIRLARDATSVPQPPTLTPRSSSAQRVVKPDSKMAAGTLLITLAGQTAGPDDLRRTGQHAAQPAGDRVDAADVADKHEEKGKCQQQGVIDPGQAGRAQRQTSSRAPASRSHAAAARQKRTGRRRRKGSGLPAVRHPGSALAETVPAAGADPGQAAPASRAAGRRSGRPARPRPRRPARSCRRAHTNTGSAGCRPVSACCRCWPRGSAAPKAAPSKVHRGHRP